MPVSFRANEANEWHFAVGSRIQRSRDDAEFVVTGHALQGLMDSAAYVLADVARNLNWIVGADAAHERYRLVDAPHYAVQRLNPTTWSVAHPAPGNGGLRHVVATCDSLMAAERHAVTLELQRAGVK